MSKLSTEGKIKRTLTHLQKLVQQYYDENPDTTDDCKGNIDTLNYYGSATVGITYNKYAYKWQTVANITLNGTYRYLDIRSRIDHKPIKGGIKTNDGIKV